MTDQQSTMFLKIAQQSAKDKETFSFPLQVVNEHKGSPSIIQVSIQLNQLSLFEWQTVTADQFRDIVEKSLPDNINVVAKLTI
jgi:hypothetical protein